MRNAQKNFPMKEMSTIKFVSGRNMPVIVWTPLGHEEPGGGGRCYYNSGKGMFKYVITLMTSGIGTRKLDTARSTTFVDEQVTFEEIHVSHVSYASI